MADPTLPTGTARPRPDLDAILAPRSVAVVGASEDPNKVGGRPIDYLRRFGYEGRVYPINPNRDVVQGLPSYPDVASLPEVPDTVIVVVPGNSAVAAVESCAAVGVRAAIVLASGFAEMSELGRTAQQRMASLATGAGMRLVGPNCQGISNFSNGSVLTFSTMFLEQPPLDGPVAVVSQSGSMSQVPYALLRYRGLGVRYCAATGNEADVSAPEIAACVASDPDIRLVLLYLETIRESRWLTELGRVAAARSLPVVALKAGITPAGQSAAISHTGALTNEDRVVDAFLDRVGIARVRYVHDLMGAVDLYLRPEWASSVPGIVVVSNSGASCVQSADAIVSGGLQLVELDPTTVERIGSVLPDFANPRNPIDLTGVLLGDSALFSQVLEVLDGDPAVGPLVVALPILGQGYDVARFARDAGRFAASGRATVAVSVNPPVADVFRDAGVPVFATEAEAVDALGQWQRWQRRVLAAVERPFETLSHPSRSEGRVVTLDEVASLAMLSGVGVPVVDHRLCTDPDSAVQAWSDLGGPVVLKGCTSRVTHKSEAGLVALAVDGEQVVREAYDRVDKALRSIDPDPPGVLVARMARGRRELMIGGRVDQVFGPVVLVGDGGAYVEALPDLQVLMAPVDRDQVVQAIGSLRIAPVLAGVRGEPPCDVEAFADAAVAASRMLLGDVGVQEMDINPVIVASQGEGCVAVDAVVRLREWRQ